MSEYEKTVEVYRAAGEVKVMVRESRAEEAKRLIGGEGRA